MRVLDLFSGLKGWSQPFADRGHETFAVDCDERFDADLHKDILQLRPEDVPWRPDVILASPPCEGFSVMNIGRNWNHDHTPKHPDAERALQLVRRTIGIIEWFDPWFAVIENPRAKLRRIPMMHRFVRQTVTYCQYGEDRMKPTDLFFRAYPPSLVLRPPCRNGDLCHVRAPRGSTTGTQGMDRAESAKIPYLLAASICQAMERDVEVARV